MSQYPDNFSWAEFDTEVHLMRTLGRFEGGVDADRPLGDSSEEFTASEFHFLVRDWDLCRYSDWFLLRRGQAMWGTGRLSASPAPLPLRTI
ncbi:hypothetical protein ABZV34_34835 [Streptomyces sp. NPDC005195]|uniref:hypothetical protein n=1 Tax=Streptomyces sp. NPDC005195 TaxID=3154561 RepID=UPI0033B447D3